MSPVGSSLRRTNTIIQVRWFEICRLRIHAGQMRGIGVGCDAILPLGEVY